MDEVLKNTNWAETISIVHKDRGMLNLTAAADKHPHKISGGMKQ